MPKENKVYLGDSVYARYAHGELVLTTENGLDSASNTIFLEAPVWKALKRFIEEHCK